MTYSFRLIYNQNLKISNLFPYNILAIERLPESGGTFASKMKK